MFIPVSPSWGVEGVVSLFALIRRVVVLVRDGYFSSAVLTVLWWEHGEPQDTFGLWGSAPFSIFFFFFFLLLGPYPPKIFGFLSGWRSLYFLVCPLFHVCKMPGFLPPGPVPPFLFSHLAICLLYHWVLSRAYTGSIEQNYSQLFSTLFANDSVLWHKRERHRRSILLGIILYKHDL